MKVFLTAIGLLLSISLAHSDSNLHIASAEDIKFGAELYQERCVLCHGENGEGDGRMAKIIKDPPPFNLTLSGAPDEYLRKIILLGGEAVGRSAQMPPWGDDFTTAEVNSLILYLKKLRAY